MNAKERSATGSSEVRPEYLVWAILGVSVGGLAVLIGLLAMMKEANLNVGLIAAFTVLSFLILLGADGVFIWMLLRSRSGAKEAGDTTRPKGLPKRELGAAQARVFPEPALSVTDHTTRTLEPASSEQKAE